MSTFIIIGNVWTEMEHNSSVQTIMNKLLSFHPRKLLTNNELSAAYDFTVLYVISTIIITFCFMSRSIQNSLHKQSGSTEIDLHITSLHTSQQVVTRWLMRAEFTHELNQLMLLFFSAWLVQADTV